MRNVQQYWKNPPENDGNSPKDYVKDHLKSIYLINLIKKLKLDVTSPILELGCNCGRNLHYLKCQGYTNLFGIEISKNAIEIGLEYYNMNGIIIENDSLENTVSKMKEKFELVFSMAVLEHLPYSSNFIFQDIVNLTNKYLICIEDEKTVSTRHFPRNYQKIFESLGLNQILYDKKNIRKVLFSNFRTRIFV